MELLRLSDLGLSPNEYNLALWEKQQKEIDKHFQESATPVFYAMFTLSVATFFAAFLQVISSVWNFQICSYSCFVPAKIFPRTSYSYLVPYKNTTFSEALVLRIRSTSTNFCTSVQTLVKHNKLKFEHL